jgi:phasin family protein
MMLAGASHNRMQAPKHPTNTVYGVQRMIQGNEQFSVAQRALMSTAQQVGVKTLEGFNKLIELNLAATKSVMNETAESWQSLLQTKDFVKFSEQSAQLAQPAAEKAASYAKHAYDIVSGTQHEIAELINKQVDEANELTIEFIDEAAKNAPAGSEAAFAFAKQSVAAARGAYDQAVAAFIKTAEQNGAAIAKAATKAKRG